MPSALLAVAKLQLAFAAGLAYSMPKLSKSDGLSVTTENRRMLVRLSRAGAMPEMGTLCGPLFETRLRSELGLKVGGSESNIADSALVEILCSL